MCDEHFEEDLKKYLKQQGMTRRQFSAMSAAAAASVLLPVGASAQMVNGSDVMIETEDGTCDAYFVHPNQGAHAGVLIWPDAMGLRTAFKQMADRLAASGYAVLAVNPYYRSAPAPVVPDGSAFGEVRGVLGPLMGSLNADTHVRDARAFVGWMDQQSAVDTGRKIGTMGYCMGGPITMRTAAALPDRVGAGASFHGGGLTSDSEDSPHLLIPEMEAEYLVAIAANDDERDPESKDILRAAFDAADKSAVVEVFEGTMHGWCPTDSAVYHHDQAEHAWSHTLTIFARALA